MMSSHVTLTTLLGLSFRCLHVYSESAGRGVELASSGMAWQSSTRFEGSADRAIDGNLEQDFTAGSCSHTRAESHPYWAVDLGEASAISRVEVYNRADCCGERMAGLTVVISDERLSAGADLVSMHYTVCGAIDTPDSVVTVSCPTQPAGRYVYLYLDQPGRQELTLCEVLVYTDEPNLALGRPSWQSSMQYGGHASRAVDGRIDQDYNQGGSCTHTRRDRTPWWAVDLGQTYTITTVTVYNREDCCGERLSGLTVLTSDERFRGGARITSQGYAACGGLGDAPPTPVISINCGAAARGRYVYLYLPTREKLTLCEVQVNGNV